MKKDIRDLFEEDNDLKTLPDGHRAEFLDKLQKQPKKKSNGFFWLGIAAVTIIALTVGFSIFYSEPVEEISPMIAQIEAVEAEYLADIETEWENFIAIADDEILISRFKRRLEELDNDYQDIAVLFKNDSNNIAVVESLIENLQTRLQLLKDIQEHIKILNQNNEQHENTI
ncbi:hypothetical protein [Winogradskyella flava]|uniref:hypothetical protein n=1 Tax=Winogradskyella flava TaxID=1884876 RepID=UPI002490A88C|nr:hypothetical protein [Winogradskyella flava]